MAKGIHREVDIERKKRRAEQTRQKREEWCIDDSSFKDIIKTLKDLSRLNEPLNEKDYSAHENNMRKVIIELHKKHPEKYFYLEQLSEFLKIPMDIVSYSFKETKDTLLKLHGFALRNKHGVGYRVANLKDVMIETDKSIGRITGLDINAIKRIYEAHESIKLNEKVPSFTSELRSLHSNFLNELEQSLADFVKDRSEIRLNSGEEFKEYQGEINSDLATTNKPPPI